ncbi:MAG: M1 family peptidase, partial [Ignavibacteriales bacterium]|nr:M1 family peptidase [Ignavibacteriales bacterium]
MRVSTAVLVGLFLTAVGSAQLLHDQKAQTFTRADSLRGMLTPLRTCYDLTYYHLDVRIDPSTKTVAGSNTVVFNVVTDFDRMQLDLFENMKIERIVLDDGRTVPFTREFGAVFLELPEKLKKDALRSVTLYYSGSPIVAKRPPWDGGFIWTEDKEGNPWVAVACQGTGASLWWPTKDHQADEPDSMLISITVPPGLQNISNGRLRETTTLPDGWIRYDWFVSYPINNYNVTVNVGKFAHFNDVYVSGSDTLTLNYYVMP